MGHSYFNPNFVLPVHVTSHSLMSVIFVIFAAASFFIQVGAEILYYANLFVSSPVFFFLPICS
jgi:hypothetical protein